jgi:hypothetical protein
MIYPGAISKETRLACCSVLDSDFRLRTKAAFERIAEQAYLFLNDLVTSRPDWHGTGVATGGPNRRIRKNQGCHMYGLPILRGKPLRAAVTEIVRGETPIRFL